MQLNKAEHVIGKHNAHLETLLKLCADEALFVGDPRHRNALFGLITEPNITVEPKFINAYSAANFNNIDILTNSRHFIPVSSTAPGSSLQLLVRTASATLNISTTSKRNLGTAGMKPFSIISNTKWTCATSTVADQCVKRVLLSRASQSQGRSHQRQRPGRDVVSPLLAGMLSCYAG